MQIPRDAVLLRIFFGEDDKFERTPLHEAIVLKAREMQLGGATVLRGHIGFGHHDLVGTERIGFDAITSDGQELLVDALDDLGPGEIEDLRDVLLPHPVALEVEGAQLQIGAHRPIKDDDPLTDKFEKRNSHD